MACIEARGLRKTFGKTVALDGVDFRVDEGRILGLIGPNGAGKTTALNAILGLTPYQGDLRVLGRDPWTERDQLMCDVAFIADVSVLPRWVGVSQALDYVAGVHPRFDRGKAESLLAKTAIRAASKVTELSKGMVAQLNLALIMSIDAKLLVLDEPTLGLDILYRKQFYDSLLNDYFDRSRTIVVTTHQVEELQDVLTDLMFINRGRIVLECSMEELVSRYVEVIVRPEHLAVGRALAPIHERQLFGRSILLFDHGDRDRPLWLLAPAQQHAAMRIAYDIAAKMIMLTAFIVGVSYCVDALHGERRDRSILFWKSLPVSDFTTVLSKASIPLVILPLLAFAVIFVTDLAILLLGTAFLLLGGLGPTALWSPLQFPSPVALAAIPIASALWFAPLYGWLLLVSGWARRAPFLWAVVNIADNYLVSRFSRKEEERSSGGLVLFSSLIRIFISFVIFIT